MPGFIATTSAILQVQPGPVQFLTQSGLSYIADEDVTLTYTRDSSVWMSGLIVSYNALTGIMLVNINSGNFGAALQPPFDTQPWGAGGGGYFGPWNLSLSGPVLDPTPPPQATIMIRRLDANWDVSYGQGLANYVTDITAVAQIIKQELLFLQGEWFENTSAGTPLFQSLLGQPTTLDAVALILRERILGVPYVTGINAFSATFLPASRNMSFHANVQTAFGTLTFQQTI